VNTDAPVPKILVVDDSEDVRLLICAALQRHFTVLDAANGDEATRLAALDQPRLVLCDVTMPGRNGCEVLRDLKANESTAHIPVVMMSGYSDQQSEDKLRALGAAGFLAKPFRLDELEAFVTGFIEPTALN
jgi:CheY-like chemotaxis protein